MMHAYIYTMVVPADDEKGMLLLLLIYYGRGGDAVC